MGCRLICGSDGDAEKLAPPWFLFFLQREHTRTHLELQSSAALGRLADAVDGDAAVLPVVRLSDVRDDEHLPVLPGDVAVVVPGGTPTTWHAGSIIWSGGWLNYSQQPGCR